MYCFSLPVNSTCYLSGTHLISHRFSKSNSWRLNYSPWRPARPPLLYWSMFSLPPPSSPYFHTCEPHHHPWSCLSILSPIPMCNTSSWMGKQLGSCAMDSTSQISAWSFHEITWIRYIPWRSWLHRGNWFQGRWVSLWPLFSPFDKSVVITVVPQIRMTGSWRNKTSLTNANVIQEEFKARFEAESSCLEEVIDSICEQARIASVCKDLMTDDLVWGHGQLKKKIEKETTDLMACNTKVRNGLEKELRQVGSLCTSLIKKELEVLHNETQSIQQHTSKKLVVVNSSYEPQLESIESKIESHHPQIQHSIRSPNPLSLIMRVSEGSIQGLAITLCVQGMTFLNLPTSSPTALTDQQLSLTQKLITQWSKPSLWHYGHSTHCSLLERARKSGPYILLQFRACLYSQQQGPWSCISCCRGSQAICSIPNWWTSHQSSVVSSLLESWQQVDVQ